ncbi:isoleucine--tRNA ligase, mitochondrial-like [Teleopsis dalmanni]|uniref:isoleucine--tRNA ligase, mitochondrial-like n=1 Tax=Teleopsis dalmanni TaxID=139649 RepID=UPI0018CF5AF4|nr:isoleucine--tRNA ligase, mitochondrial-like [Teleopsis dalmanni]XP_037954245.1 isoleucine--tRNA ligase, mitochondrial-like [Teleopsis dalmanni]
MLKFVQKSFSYRFYSIKHATEKPIKYTHTINLPKTKFPNRLTAAKRVEIEQQLLETKFASGYRYQEAHNKEPTFVLHDGPPYANGDLHMGHAVNKILKDITLRQHASNGEKVNYIPGWDCHGLPIELKALNAVDNNVTKDIQSVREKSRQFALNAIKNQKTEFRNWGILSDWDDPKNIYLTTNPDFIINQLKLFLNLYEKGLVYRDLKPVYWSPSSRSALAEAELEYNPNFVSPSVYVRFALTKLPTNITKMESKIHALVWTTTPWTLPSNQAICYNSALEYAIVKLHDSNKIDMSDLYLIATNLIQEFEETTTYKCEVLHKIKGTDLSECTYQHPIYKDQQTLPFFAADHVKDTKGTGLVHTAPAHGPEDFLVSLEHKLKVQNYVNANGVYTMEAPEFLRGKSVLDEGDKLVIDHIAKDIVHASKFTHAYPIDWRTKEPVIIRASEQWFINTAEIKDRAVKELEKVEIYPRVNAEASKKNLTTQLLKRPYWCISRQRAWGVPIPAFYNNETNEVIINRDIIQHICDIIQKESNVDFWWSKSVDDILPKKLIKDLNLPIENITKGLDIFDIWFDSGSTWSSVLKQQKVADVYLEGYDQFTGWFQSSLLTSVAARNCAPYKSIFVHGFTVDEKGNKMSKSIGNVISPKEITKKYGVDVLRWWVASHATQNMSIIVSDKILQQSAESLSKIRATLRYLNGVINEKSTTSWDSDDQSYLNRYLLSCLVDFEEKCQNSYNCYEYHRVVSHILNFVANQISATYLHLIKDRLYCGDNDELASIRYTVSKCYEILCKSLWPITPFLIEESWSFYDAKNAFYQQKVLSNPSWRNENIENALNTALKYKRLINQKLSDVNTWTLAVSILPTNEETLEELNKLQIDMDTPVSRSELCEILQVGKVTLLSSIAESARTPETDFLIDIKVLDIILCPRCRRYAVKDETCICQRCTEVLSLK